MIDGGWRPSSASGPPRSGTYCLPEFEHVARRILLDFPPGPQRWKEQLTTGDGLRRTILHKFIADFANWDNAADPAYLQTAGALVGAGAVDGVVHVLADNRIAVLPGVPYDLGALVPEALLLLDFSSPLCPRRFLWIIPSRRRGDAYRRELRTLDERNSVFLMPGNITVLPEYADTLAAAGLTSLEALMAHAGIARLDKPGLQSWRQRLRIELPSPDGLPLIAYLKRYRSPPIYAQRQRIVRGTLRHGTAWIEWYWSHRLIADGINVAPPIALAESMRGGRELASAILTAAAPGQSLESLAPIRKTCEPRASARAASQMFGDSEMLLTARPDIIRDRDIIAELARFVARFHRLGYVHRDLYLSHVFFDRDAPPHRRFCLIDLHRVMRPRCFRRRWFVKDLAALNYSTPVSFVSTAARIRFLITYLRENASAGSLRNIVDQVIRKTAQISRHDARRLAQLAHEPTGTPEGVP